MEDKPVDGALHYRLRRTDDLEAFPRLLKKLSATFDSVRMNLRTCVLWLSLSGTLDEDILLVFHLACTDVQSVVDMSRVCMRFRRIALSSSRLWVACPLTLDMPSHIIGMIASRSGSHGITVRFEAVHSMKPRRMRSLSCLGIDRNGTRLNAHPSGIAGMLFLGDTPSFAKQDSSLTKCHI